MPGDLTVLPVQYLKIDHCAACGKKRGTRKLYICDACGHIYMYPSPGMKQMCPCDTCNARWNERILHLTGTEYYGRHLARRPLAQSSMTASLKRYVEGRI